MFWNRATGFSSTPGPVALVTLMVLYGLIVAPRVHSERLPTVGDPIELHYELKSNEWVSIEGSERFEVVSRVGGQVVIRSFEPGSFMVRARIESSDGKSRIEERTITVASVLAENDSLEPAPLEAPHPLPPNRVAFGALVVAGLLAVGAWGVLFLVRPEKSGLPLPRLSAVEELRRALTRIEAMRDGDEKLIRLGAAVRQYLARADGAFGEEMTSTEILATLDSRVLPATVISVIREILDEADYAKFSGYGGRGFRCAGLASQAWLVTHVVREEEGPS